MTPPTAAASHDRDLELKLVSVMPTAAQLRWHQMHSFYGFVHFGVNGFTDREWGTGTESPAIFNPTELDARQWARTMRAAGMSLAIITAKHHDGFCLWPSRYTQHSVASSPYKNGQGDVVREFVNAMRDEGIAIGIYLSPADLYQIENPEGYYGDLSTYVDSVIPTNPETFKTDPTQSRRAPQYAPVLKYKADSYNRYFLNQLYELLTEYGPIDEVWFDGATPKSKGGQQYTYKAWYDLVRTLQPNAVIFGKGPDVRWVGNEYGFARETEWNIVGLNVPASENDWLDLRDQDLGSREVLAKYPYLHWYPAEADTSIRPGWFWHEAENNRVKSADTLMDIYLKSVGRNATFLLNVPPDRRGLFHENDVAEMLKFGQRLRETYGTNFAKGASTTASSTLRGTFASNLVDGNNNTYWEAEPWQSEVSVELTLAKPCTFNQVLLREQLTRSQRVEEFTLFARTNSEWRKISSATTIGTCRILSFPELTADAIRIVFNRFRVAPTLSEIGLYHETGRMPAPMITRAIDGTVSIAPLPAEWSIRYSIGHADASADSPLYTSPIALPDGGRVSAVAIRNSDQAVGAPAIRHFGYAKSTLKIISDSSDAQRALDENDSTFATIPGRKLIIDLGQPRPVRGFTYLPRQDTLAPGMLDRYTVYVSDSPAATGEALATGRMDNIWNSPDERLVRFAKPVTGRYLIIEALSTLETTDFITIAEIGVLGDIK